MKQGLVCRMVVASAIASIMLVIMMTQQVSADLVSQQTKLRHIVHRDSMVDEFMGKLGGSISEKFGRRYANDKGPNEVFTDLRQKYPQCFSEPRDSGSGKCYANYAFTAIAQAEFMMCRATGQYLAFSEQYVIDCGKQFGGDSMRGCAGGKLDATTEFFNNFGFELRDQYPYREQDGQCPYAPETDLNSVGHIRADLRKVVSFHVDLWEKALESYGPLAVFIKAGAKVKSYTGGVFDDCNDKNDAEPDQIWSGLVVGDGREDNKEFWIVRNSRGTNWGEGGYMKLAKRANCLAPEYGYTFGSPDAASGALVAPFVNPQKAPYAY